MRETLADLTRLHRFFKLELSRLMQPERGLAILIFGIGHVSVVTLLLAVFRQILPIPINPCWLTGKLDAAGAEAGQS